MILCYLLKVTDFFFLSHYALMNLRIFKGFIPLEFLIFMKFKLSSLWPSRSLNSYSCMTLVVFGGSLLFGIIRHFRLTYVFPASKNLEPGIFLRSPCVLVENCTSKCSMLLNLAILVHAFSLDTLENYMCVFDFKFYVFILIFLF